MKFFRCFVILFIFIFLFLNYSFSAQEISANENRAVQADGTNALYINRNPFKLSLESDSTVLIFSSVFFGINLLIKTSPLTTAEISSLNKYDISSFDRIATNYWSTSWKTYSDISVGVLIAAPLIFLAGENTRDSIFTIAVMYSESLLITLALNQSVKTNSPRIRPFVYNNNAPDKEKTDKDAVKSFYSGHTAFAFNTAVFLSYVFGEYYPKSPLRYVIWPTSLLLAGSIAFARVRAGKHFPTDVIVGAALGGFSGFLVPYLHRNKETSVSFVPLFGETNGVAFIKRF